MSAQHHELTNLNGNLKSRAMRVEEIEALKVLGEAKQSMPRSKGVFLRTFFPRQGPMREAVDDPTRGPVAFP